MLYVNLFKKKGADFERFWISVRTPVYDAKKKKTTDDYITAQMPARLTNEAKEKFDELAIKSSGKKTTWNRFELKEFKFEAVQPKDSDYGYVRVVIFDLELAPKKDEDDEDD